MAYIYTLIVSHICCLFQSWQSRQSLYLHRNWNYQKFCVSTSIGKLNILETCIFFFFFPHLNKLSHGNAWPGTASINIYNFHSTKGYALLPVQMFFTSLFVNQFNFCSKIFLLTLSLGTSCEMTQKNYSYFSYHFRSSFICMYLTSASLQRVKNPFPTRSVLIWH